VVVVVVPIKMVMATQALEAQAEEDMVDILMKMQLLEQQTQAVAVVEL
jgi:hypothetical protein